MYSAKSEGGNQPPPDAGKFLRLGIAALIGIIAFLLVGNQAVVLFMNVEEFAEIFTTPLYFALVSAVILSGIALIRVNIVKRHSIFWYSLSTVIGFMNRNPNGAASETITSFHNYKLSGPHFVIWQFTKVVLFGAFFANIMFGFAAMYVIDGNDLGVENISAIFSLPFVTPPTDHSYATEKVIPMIPALLVLVPPILGVIGLRLLLFVGLHHIYKVITSYIQDSAEGKPKWLNYTSSFEAIVGIGVIWSAFNMFFGENIDYNTKYAIGGTFVIGFALIAFSIFDKMRSRVLTHMLKRDVYIRIFTIIAIAVIVGIAMSVNTSIADAKKIEYLGPYTAQQIGVNRYLGELDQVEELVNNEVLKSVPVVASHTTMKDALKRGALALFGEKYGDEVRILEMGDFSTELCGGTHVQNTAEIGLFTIISEGSLSSGVRRIEATTSENAIKRLNERSKLLRELEVLTSSSQSTITTKIQSLFDEVKKAQKEIKSLKNELTSKDSQDLFSNPEKLKGDIPFKYAQAPEGSDLRKLSDLFMDKNPNGVVLLTMSKNDKLAVLLRSGKKSGIPCNNILKETLSLLNGRGGGRPDMAQGSGEGGDLDTFVQKTRELLEQSL